MSGGLALVAACLTVPTVATSSLGAFFAARTVSSPPAAPARAGPPRDGAIHVARRPVPAAVAVHHARAAASAETKTSPAARSHRKSTHEAVARKASVHAPSGPTSWGALNAAIARIPTYRSGEAHWVVKNTGWWGTSDWYANVIYISPAVPDDKLYSVAVHEWSHLLSVRDYDGNVTAAVAAMTAYFGGAGLMGAEYAADCMAIAQGATWTHYTSCASSKWRTGARDLVSGNRLPELG